MTRETGRVEVWYPVVMTAYLAVSSGSLRSNLPIFLTPSPGQCNDAN